MALYTVDTLADTVDAADGLTSLREALASASAYAIPGVTDRIEFSVVGTILLNGDALLVGADVIVDGGGSITLDAQDRSRVVSVEAGTSVLTGLTITGGRTGSDRDPGAGMYVARAATVTLLDSVVTGNATDLFGGGVYNNGTLTIARSTISYNFGFEDGGGITNSHILSIADSIFLGNSSNSGGGFANVGGNSQATLVNTSFVDNEATIEGGAIYNATGLDLNHVTITGNTSEFGNGGGIWIADHGDGVRTHIQNSIISGNRVLFGADADFGSPSPNTTIDGSVIGGDPASIFAVTLDADGIPSGVAADNGGPVWTVALSSDPYNPAVDAGGNPSGTPLGDARGNGRAVDILQIDNGGIADAGAYELGSAPLPPPPPLPEGLVLLGTSGPDILTGSVGDDTFYAGADFADTIIGGEGRDLVDYAEAGEGLTIDLGSARPYRYGPGPDIGSAQPASTGGRGRPSPTDPRDRLEGIEDIRGTAFADTIYGSDGDNLVMGAGGKDILYGRGGDDVLVGGNGNDTLGGGEGADSLDGGAGFDIAAYTSAADGENGVTVSLAPSGWVNAGNAAGDTFAGIEGVSGSRGDDRLGGDANGNILIGGRGNDTLAGFGGDDTLSGGAGDDTLIGGAGADTLDGGAGFDIVSYADLASPDGRLGVTAFLLDIGLSARSGDASGDVYIDIEGLEGSQFVDVLYGSRNDDVLIGLGGDDFLGGRDGADTIDGGDGMDTVFFGDTFDGPRIDDNGLIVDLLYQHRNTGTAEGDVYVDVENIIGWNGGDELRGDSGANVLTGSLGDDRLFGRGGDDVLSGGSGTDVLKGGTGRDSFSFIRPLDGGDFIVDFVSGEDTIVLALAGFRGLEAGRLTADDLGVGPEDADHLLYRAGGSLFYDYDAGGAGAAVRLFSLGPAPIGGPEITFAATDILIE